MLFHVLWFFWRFFSILAEKQHTKPIDSSSLKFFASFDAYDIPRSAKIKPEWKFDQMSLCADKSIYPYVGHCPSQKLNSPNQQRLPIDVATYASVMKNITVECLPGHLQDQTKSY